MDDVKKINIKGKVLEMNFEQCYCQFAPLRIKLVNQYRNLPLDLEDLAQEVDIAFYKAYTDYSNLDIAFITLATTYIIHELNKINTHYKRKVRRNNNGSDLSFNGPITIGENEVTLENLISCESSNFENDVLAKVSTEKVLSTMREDKAYTIKKFLKGYSLAEIARELGVSKRSTSNYKREFVMKFNKELCC